VLSLFPTKTGDGYRSQSFSNKPCNGFGEHWSQRNYQSPPWPRINDQKGPSCKNPRRPLRKLVRRMAKLASITFSSATHIVGSIIAGFYQFPFCYGFMFCRLLQGIAIFCLSLQRVEVSFPEALYETASLFRFSQLPSEVLPSLVFSFSKRTSQDSRHFTSWVTSPTHP